MMVLIGKCCGSFCVVSTEKIPGPEDVMTVSGKEGRLRQSIKKTTWAATETAHMANAASMSDCVFRAARIRPR